MSSGVSGLFELVRCLLALGWCWAIGAAVVSLLTSRIPRDEFHATALLVGIGVITLELFAFSQLGVPWNLPGLVVAGLPLVAFALWRANLRPLRTPASPEFHAGLGTPPQDRVRQVVAAAPLLLLGIVLLVSTCTAWLIPSGRGQNPDGYGFYLLKARMFFIDGGIASYFLEHEGLAFSAPDHPILMSLAVTWMYLAIGAIKQEYAALINPLFFVALVTIFVRFAQRMGLSFAMAAMLSALLGIPLLIFVPLVAYTDLAVGVYLLVAVNFVDRWMEARRTGDAVLGALCFGFAAWTKNEGLAMYYVSSMGLVVLGVRSLVATRTLQRPAVGWLILILLPYIVIWPWAHLKSSYAVTQVHGELAMLTNMTDLLARLSEGAVLLPLWLGIRAALQWNVLVLVFIGALAMNVRREWSAAGPVHGAPGSGGLRRVVEKLAAINSIRLYTFLLMVGTVTAGLVGMLASPDPVAALIRHVTPRLIAQLTPLFFMMLTFELGALLRHQRAPALVRASIHRSSIHATAMSGSS